jgi:hypothetical protein
MITMTMTIQAHSGSFQTGLVHHFFPGLLSLIIAPIDFFELSRPTDHNQLSSSEVESLMKLAHPF